MQYLTNNCTEKLFNILVDLFIDELNNLLNQQEIVNVALPGGRSIIRFFQILHCQFSARSNCISDPSRVYFYLTDERVSTNRDELNENQLNNIFFDSLNTTFKTFFELSNRFDEYNKFFAPTNKFFDFVFLGAGEDGHIASIFPKQNNALLSKAYYLEVISLNKSPPQRITLSQKAILEAKNIIVLFIGTYKRQALKNFQNSKISVEMCPVKLVFQKSEKVRIVSNII